ncbi:hypothetical protein F5Y06DRAFT_299346 [Hypoxylon sp. FL0890]|nr:hypothetical protein F5Y06DRAFT_299346 [Hypoxylon sp. FL0890]
MPNAIQDGVVQPKDDESISKYFDLDQAAAPESTDQDTPEESGKSDKDIPGFEPIVDRKDGDDKLRSKQEAPRENFSGGSGPYVWPQSSQVMMSPQSTLEDFYEYLRIKREAEANRRDNSEKKSDIDTLPSQIARINWKKEIQQVYRPN